MPYIKVDHVVADLGGVLSVELSSGLRVSVSQSDYVDTAVPKPTYNLKAASVSLHVDTTEAVQQLDALKAELEKVQIELAAAKAQASAPQVKIVVYSDQYTAPSVDAHLGMTKAKALSHLTDSLDAYGVTTYQQVADDYKVSKTANKYPLSQPLLFSTWNGGVADHYTLGALDSCTFEAAVGMVSHLSAGAYESVLQKACADVVKQVSDFVAQHSVVSLHHDKFADKVRVGVTLFYASTPPVLPKNQMAAPVSWGSAAANPYADILAIKKTIHHEGTVIPKDYVLKLSEQNAGFKKAAEAYVNSMAEATEKFLELGDLFAPPPPDDAELDVYEKWPTATDESLNDDEDPF